MTNISIEQLAHVTGGQKKNDTTLPSSSSAAHGQQKIETDSKASPSKAQKIS